MPGKATTLETNTLDWLFAMGIYASSGAMKDALSYTALFFGIFKGDPEGAGVEISGGSYARVSVGFGAANWSRTGSVVSNDNDIDWPIPTADWAGIGSEATHWTVHSAASAGVLLWSKELSVPRQILIGDPVSLVAGQVQFLED